jgi:hypothetical protein
VGFKWVGSTNGRTARVPPNTFAFGENEPTFYIAQQGKTEERSQQTTCKLLQGDELHMGQMYEQTNRHGNLLPI